MKGDMDMEDWNQDPFGTSEEQTPNSESSAAPENEQTASGYTENNSEYAGSTSAQDSIKPDDSDSSNSRNQPDYGNPEIWNRQDDGSTDTRNQPDYGNPEIWNRQDDGSTDTRNQPDYGNPDVWNRQDDGAQNTWNTRSSYEQGGEQNQGGTEADGRQPYSSRYDAYRFQEPKRDGWYDPNETPQQPKKSNRRGSRKPLIAVLVALVLAACVVTAVIASRVGSSVSTGTAASSDNSVTFGNSENGDSTASDAESSADSTTESENTGSLPDVIGSAGSTQNPDMTVAEVAALAMPAMVQITNTSLTQYYNMFGQTQEYESVSAGSGILIGENDEEYLIATNEHVISDSESITVTFVDDAAVSGTVKAADSVNDLAVVSVLKSDMESSTIDAISVITIGDSDALVVGEQVVAIGNALGYGQSVSAGYVSALNRDVTVDNVTHQLIQTDASINPGNSGGALLNMRGELIGINEIKYVNSSVEGVGYAIPTATAEPILEELGTAEPKTALSEEERGYLGVTCMDMPSSYVAQGYPAGAYLYTVNAGSPAAEAGLQAQDIITAVNGTTVDGQEELITELSYYASGETVQITYSRLNSAQTDFESYTVSVTLGDRSSAGLDSQETEDTSGQENENSNNGFRLPGAQ